MRYLLDTNICVHWLRGKWDIDKAIDRVGLANCCISEITKAELLFGMELRRRKTGKDDSDILQRLFSLIEVIPISEALEMYAKEKARLAMSGNIVEDFDLIIACTAVSAGAILVTENLSHLERISGVRIENWVSR